MLLYELGLDEAYAGDDAVAILVGPNGSGKSNLLREIALQYRRRRPVAVVCNTAFDRFARLSLTNRLALGRGDQSAKSSIKRAMGTALDGRGSEFYQVGSALIHCHYKPRLGFKPVLRPKAWLKANPMPDPEGALLKSLSMEQREDFDRACHFVMRSDPDEIIWIDAQDSAYEYSRSREFATVLRSEALLRRAGLLKDIDVFLDKFGDPMELQHASSGELTLIASLLFLICVVPENAIVLIDEPENSLHPSWQREFVEKLLSALAYRRTSIVIATHAPLLVTGAIAYHGDRVAVYRVNGRQLHKLPIDHRAASPSGVEEILWRAFEVVTPANHFVSGQIVDAIDRYERGEIPKWQVLHLVEDMRSKSFDGKQQAFFTAIEGLVDKVEASKSQRGDADSDQPHE